ncbi:type IX secretion system sortase PorU [bacterium]|nr:type IX secretion system sortase PorU [bacterium]
MKKILCYIFVVMLWQTAISKDPDLLSTDDRGCSVAISLENFSVEASKIQGYQQIKFNNYAPAGKPGEPMIPKRILLFALPVGATATATVSAGRLDVLSDVSLLPVPELKGPSLNPEVFIEGDSYKSSTMMPESMFEYDIVEMGGVRLLRVEYCPVRYNPVRKELAVTYDAVITVRFQVAAPVTRSPQADMVFIDHVINADQYRSWPVIERKRAEIAKHAVGGEWCKLSLDNEGIYSITGKWLEDQGVDISTIDVSTVKVLFNGARELAKGVETTKLDSLMEMPIQFNGDSDNQWEKDESVLFYASGISGVHWEGGMLRHHLHRYDLHSVAWLVFNDGQVGKRLETDVDGQDNNAITIESFIDLAYVEHDLNNPAKAGNLWYGQEFRASFSHRTLELPMSFPVANELYRFRIKMAGMNDGTHTLDCRLNGQQVAIAVAGGDRDAETVVNWAGDPGSGPYTISMDYLYTSGSSKNPIAYLDWFEVQYTRQMMTDTDYLRYFTPQLKGLYRCRLSGFSAEPYVWDVTDPENISRKSVVADGTIYTVLSDNADGTACRLIAFDDTAVLEPTELEKVLPLNLRLDSIGAQLVIIAHSDFLSEAQRLADHRRSYSGISVNVVDIADVYNNFSWGLVDPVAIRDFLRYSQLHWDTAPEYVLLMGDGDFDVRNILSDEDKNWIPPFEHDGRKNNTGRATDDFYAYLQGDDTILDIAIGRIPVRSVEEAGAVVDKIITTDSQPLWGSWRNLITLVGDDEFSRLSSNETTHSRATERLADFYIPARFKTRKIYLIEHEKEVTGDGSRKPLVNQAIIQQVNDGTVWLNYIGHGNHNLWSDELIFHKDIDFPLIQNNERFPFIYAATCSFGRYDQIEEQSFAEILINAPARGAIALISASRDCHASANEALNAMFTKTILSEIGSGLTLGKALQVAKNNVSSSRQNNEMYHLFGDPSMHLPVPKYAAQITDMVPDTLKALSVVNVKGEVQRDGVLWSEFSGHVSFEVHDARRDRIYTTGAGSKIDYDLAGNAIFRGESDVTNGSFEISFIVPKDITYGGTTGSLTCYFWSDTTDGCGYKHELSLAGSENITDIEGPELSLYFTGRPSFFDGDAVATPLELVVAANDEKTGVNITGEIGHKLIITLDEKDELDATDLFHYDKGSYLSGRVIYPLTDILPGHHEVSVKVWDNANNSSLSVLGFEVVEGGKIRIDDLLNYPNPMSSSTHFTFRLNYDADVEIKIYTVAGRLIRILEDVEGSAGFNMVQWDGLDVMGDAPGNGVYLYKVFVESRYEEETMRAEKLGRLLIVR